MSAYRQNAEQLEPDKPVTEPSVKYHDGLQDDELAFWEQAATAALGGVCARDKQWARSERVDAAADYADMLLVERNKRKNGGHY
jgi:hypothetical protein